MCDRRGFDPHDVFASYKGVTFAGEPLSPRARTLAESWGIELFEHGNVGDVTGSFECPEHDGLHYWEDTVFVEGIDRSRCRRRPGRARGVEPHEHDRAAAALPLRRHRAPLDRAVRVRSYARAHVADRSQERRGARAGPSVLPVDVWAAVETVDACALGLFQVIRDGRETDTLRLRVGYLPEWEQRARHGARRRREPRCWRRSASSRMSSWFRTTALLEARPAAQDPAGGTIASGAVPGGAPPDRTMRATPLGHRVYDDERGDAHVADLERRDRPRHRRGEQACSASSGSRGKARVVVLDARRNAGQFWPYVLRHGDGRRPLVVRRRDRR